MSSSETILLPEMVSELKDRLKHGRNVVKILESQVDTAQQNILLLQGQVTLAKETISNLKKHFQETENLIANFFDVEPQLLAYDHVGKSVAKETCRKAADNASPMLQDSGTESNKSFDGNKSPYAQQLRQVVDALQDEEPQKTRLYSESDVDKESAWLGCKSTPKHSDYNLDYCKSNHRIYSRSNSRNVSPKSFHSIHAPRVPSHCSGPCHSTADASGFKVVEKSAHTMYYADSHSPAHVQQKCMEHHPGHCGEKCQCHAFVNYMPFGYHVIESSPGIPESIRPISPSSKRKRSYVINEEHPRLKYTKVKRIDGSKLTAQKTLQDFTKRRCFAYDPRYDLDLLIVPPPIPAFDLIKDGKAVVEKLPQNLLNVDEFILNTHVVDNNVTERTGDINGVDTLANKVDINYDDININEEDASGQDNNDGVLNSCSNSDNDSNGDNSITISNGSVDMNTHTVLKSTSSVSNVKLSVIIKEENVEEIRTSHIHDERYGEYVNA